MRERFDIEKVTYKSYKDYNEPDRTPALLCIAIEVLLDIRELLQRRLDTLDQHGV